MLRFKFVGAGRGLWILPTEAEVEAFLTTTVFAETKATAMDPSHPFFKLFPEFVEQLRSLAA